MKRYTLLFSLLSLYALHAVTLSEVLERVNKSDLALSYHYSAKADEAKLSSVKAAYLPKVEANYIYSYLPDEYIGPFDPKQSGQLTAQAVLFDGFARYNRIKAADKNAKAAQLNATYQIQSLALNALTLYFNILSLDADIKATKQKQKQLQNETRRLEQFYKAKTLSEDKLEEIKAALAMSNYELAIKRQNRKELGFALESIVGQKLDTLKPTTLKEPDFKEEQLPLNLKAQAQSIEALYHQAKAQSSRYLPTIIIKDTLQGVEYYPSNLNFPPSLAITFPSVTNKIQLIAKMTLFDFFKSSHEKEELMLKKLSAQKALDYKKHDHALKKQLARIKLQTSKERIASAHSSFQASKKAYDYIKKRYKAHLVDSSRYLNALSQLSRSQALLSRAKNDYQIALANYYFTVAKNLKEMIQ